MSPYAIYHSACFYLSCVSCAGVAAEKVGSDFIPVVAETFGVWKSFALKE